MWTRWTPNRKKNVVESILKGYFTRETYMKRYDISAEELESWIRTYQAGLQLSVANLARHLGASK